MKLYQSLFLEFLKYTLKTLINKTLNLILDSLVGLSYEFEDFNNSDLNYGEEKKERLI